MLEVGERGGAGAVGLLGQRAAERAGAARERGGDRRPRSAPGRSRSASLSWTTGWTAKATPLWAVLDGWVVTASWGLPSVASR